MSKTASSNGRGQTGRAANPVYRAKMAGASTEAAPRYHVERVAAPAPVPPTEPAQPTALMVINELTASAIDRVANATNRVRNHADYAIGPVPENGETSPVDPFPPGVAREAVYRLHALHGALTQLEQEIDRLSAV